jgi:hypothetical protein
VALRVFSVDLSTAMKMRAADDELRPCSSPTTPAEGFDKLSDQMLLEILSYVPHDDYLNIRLVNRRFNRISEQTVPCGKRLVSPSFRTH